MKKFLALLLAMTMVMALVACGNQNNAPADNKPSDNQTQNDKQPEDNKTPDTTEPATAEEITLWTYPVGNWGDEANVKAITDAFTADTGIKVTVEYLDYTNGDDKVNTALTAGNQPDLVLEGPERLVANWGANGHMVDLSDLIDAADEGEFIPAAYNACVNAEGKVYEYPMCMTAHCMAINYEVFEAAGALQYIDEETRTWTTEGFEAAMANGALAGYTMDSMKVTLKDGSFHPVDSDQLSFEIAARNGYRHAAPKAGSVILEPIMSVEVLTPEESMGDIIGDLNKRRGQIQGMESKGNARVVKAKVPLSEMFGYVTVLRTISSGRATSSMEFSHFEEVPANLAKEIIEKSGHKNKDIE